MVPPCGGRTVRLNISSNGKGESGGARVITPVHIAQGNVYLLTIYDKSRKEDLDWGELELLLKMIRQQPYFASVFTICRMASEGMMKLKFPQMTSSYLGMTCGEKFSVSTNTSVSGMRIPLLF